MSHDFVESVIRRLNLKLLLLSLAGLLLVFIGLAASTRYLYNLFLGPFPIASADLVALQNPGDRWQYYVTVTADDHVNTGYTYVSTSDSGKETIEAYYHALVIGDSLLLVKSKTEGIGNQETGALVNLPTETNTEVIAALEQEMPNLKGVFLPMMLDTFDFRTSGYLGLGAAALVGLLSMGGLLVAVVRLANPQGHPALKSLTHYGPLSAVIGEIDMEITSPHEQVSKKIHFTRRWLVSTASSLQAAPYRDLVWCYKKITQHRTNGIPTHKTYAAHVYDRFGKGLILPGKEAEVNQMLATLVRMTPGIIPGYSDELNKAWLKDRPGFVAAVEARRRAGPTQIP